MNSIFLVLIGFYFGFLVSSWYFKKVNEHFFNSTSKQKQKDIPWQYDSEGRPVDD